MTKRDEQRRQADRNFGEVRKAIAAQSTEWLCDALREIPPRKWIEIEKDQHVAVGGLAHRAADRIAELEVALRGMEAMYARVWDRVDGALVCMPDNVDRFEKAHADARKALGL